MPASLVIGASSSIATALIAKLRADRGNKFSKNNVDNSEPYLVCISRQRLKIHHPGEIFLHCDYSESSISQLCDELSEQGLVFEQVFIFNGVLHKHDFMPEKRLQDITTGQLIQSFSANTLIPLLCLAKLAPLLKSSPHRSLPKITIAVLSARVASITDNQLGGWYSYRATKAALNMALKCAAIELKRSHKNVKLIAFHPGTTQSPLSQPFQKNVAEGKLFQPEFVANQLLEICSKSKVDGKLSYLDWNNKEIPW
ncbi:short-chain dehydrogenase [Agaribacterium haliotis]|uniref:short-chain dehydrogenase n=1 Tax=Agaribacterium haliotis TaxID=2013869 RepID=UPI00195D6F98|nr:short-chain dehydrogenase [Agaribacterium haliotis]